MLVSYNLGERQAVNRALMPGMPTTQMVIGPDGIARPYLVQAGQTALGQPLTGQSAWAPYGTMTPGTMVPYGYQNPVYQGAYPVQTQYCHRASGCPADGASGFDAARRLV